MPRTPMPIHVQVHDSCGDTVSIDQYVTDRLEEISASLDHAREETAGNADDLIEALSWIAEVALKTKRTIKKALKKA